VIRHRAARWLVAAATGLTLIGCQQGTDQSASPRPAETAAPASSTTAAGRLEVKAVHASAPPVTTTVAPAPDPLPAEMVTPWEPPTTTSTTTTTIAPPAPEPAAPRTVRPASAPSTPAPSAPPAAVAPIDTGGAASLTARTNSVRASVGLPALERDGSLDAAAIDWARELAASGRLRHSTITKSIIGKPWTSAGENVGVGPSVDAVHDALVASAGHYANIAGASFTRVGVGVATDASGQVWVVEVFAGS
jgi:uncharacterized protein YkwD